VPHIGQNRRINFATENRLPVQALKPLVLADIIPAAAQIA